MCARAYFLIDVELVATVDLLKTADAAVTEECPEVSCCPNWRYLRQTPSLPAAGAALAFVGSVAIEQWHLAAGTAYLIEMLFAVLDNAIATF
mmetsp:Transcript_46633/g.56439  ORF Transcript_46633/g.56439 Transcript_46633/m.56439 type:complete len:92 (+) Transcript_46633:4406-4681(+)